VNLRLDAMLKMLGRDGDIFQMDQPNYQNYKNISARNNNNNKNNNYKYNDTIIDNQQNNRNFSQINVIRKLLLKNTAKSFSFEVNPSKIYSQVNIIN
jgi:hypothetical protein